MSTPLRNVDADFDEPVEQWPFEAVLTAVDRGEVTLWSRLIAGIRADPWGPVTDCVRQALEIAEPYGVAPLMRAVISDAVRDAEQLERQQVAQRVREAVAASGLTQAQFARRMGTSASRLSSYANGHVVPGATMLLRIERGIRSPAAT